MILFLKKFIKYLCQGKIILLSGLLILLFLALPFPTLAIDIVAGLRNLGVTFTVSLISLGLIVVIFATGGIAFVMGTILDWVISPGFIGLSYTRPCLAIYDYLPNPLVPGDTCNSVIGLGLNITQSFVNMILVVILVYIALSIALRIGEQRQTQQTFYKLVVVALLVNFTPVFCGLIVDAANIIMNSFLEPLHGGVSGVLAQCSTFWDATTKYIGNAGGDIVKSLGLLALGEAQIALNLCIAFAFFLFAGLFIVRYIAIWVLVILSPLAFAFWILPATKKLWDMWWNNFIQWSIIGIPIAFFLYLALSSFSQLSKTFRADLTSPELGGSTIGAFNQLFPFIVIIVFLMLGFIIGLATSAMGANAIIKGGKAAGLVAGKKGWGATKAAGRGIGRGAAATGRAVVRKPAAGIAEMRRSFRARIEEGATPGEAARGAVREAAVASWQRRKDIVPAIKRAPGAAVKAIKRAPGAAVKAWPAIKKAGEATGRGAWSALKDMTQAGVIAGLPGVAKALGIPKKKTGQVICGTCGDAVPASSIFCPSCGNKI